MPQSPEVIAKVTEMTKKVKKTMSEIQRCLKNRINVDTDSEEEDKEEPIPKKREVKAVRKESIELKLTAPAATGTRRKSSWSDGEHAKFIEAIRIYGKDWKKIEKHVGTKSYQQIVTHSKEFINKCKKNSEIEGSDLIHVLEQKLKKGRKPASQEARTPIICSDDEQEIMKEAFVCDIESDIE